MKSKTALRSELNIESLIQTIRSQKIILAADLALIYGVSTKRLNEQVRRNAKRFPIDFVFRLTRKEAGGVLGSRSQIATLKRGQNIKYLPYAFTEQGAIMAANVLNSSEAVRMSVYVVRAFVKMRELLSGTRELAQQLKKLETELKGRLNVHETVIVDVLQRIMQLLDPPLEQEPARGQIGFHVRQEKVDVSSSPRGSLKGKGVLKAMMKERRAMR
jgi:phage regulator Rha-like protein